MRLFPALFLAFAAGAAAALAIGSLHAQTPPTQPAASSTLVMQAATQALATAMPVTFILDVERRRLKTCRAPAATPAGPVCGAWTDLGS